MVEKAATSQEKLWKIAYFDYKNSVNLTAYADTVVYESIGGSEYLTSIRFGGYPEQVRGMSDAIFGGGTIDVNINNSKMTLRTYPKRYQRIVSNEGNYSEATLLIKDELTKNQVIDVSNDTDNSVINAENTDNGVKNTRKSYFFCGNDNILNLYEAIDAKVNVPMIPDFADFLIKELISYGILKQLNVKSLHENFQAWTIEHEENDANIVRIIENGLRSGDISIPGAKYDNAFQEINTVSDYLNCYGLQIGEKIKSIFTPLFDPANDRLSNEILEINSYVNEKAGYYLYDAQLAVAESIKRHLQKNKCGLVVAECGSGKSKIGAMILGSYQLSKKMKKAFNIVLCPAHLGEKWIREIKDTIPNTEAYIVKNVEELKQVYSSFLMGSKTYYIIITKEKARDGYMVRPAVSWNNVKNAFVCPSCGEIIKMELLYDNSRISVNANSAFFRTQNKKNRKCEHCNTVLWTVLDPDAQTDWVKISDYGFVHRKFALSDLRSIEEKAEKAKQGCESEVLSNEKPEDSFELFEQWLRIFDMDSEIAFDEAKTIDESSNFNYPKYYFDICEVVDNPDGHFKALGAYTRFPLSLYIRKKMKGKIDGLIIDELQDYNNSSGQGDAMYDLMKACKKSVGLTGTLSNGYAKGLFYLMYRICPELMLFDEKTYEDSSDFSNEYGVIEFSEISLDPEYNANRRTSIKTVEGKALPGVSPLIYSRFLMGMSCFLSLKDIGKQLPEYIETPVELTLKKETMTEYFKVFDAYIKTQEDKKLAKKVMSSFMSLLTAYPDQPYNQKEIRDPITGTSLAKPADTSTIEELNQKDNWILQKVKEKISCGGKVIIFTCWTRLDTQEKLTKILEKEGYNVKTLTTRIKPSNREAWLKKQIEDGMQILITNPALVETGLDLNDFPTLIYYNISYKLFTLRQSSRRSWRINQKAPLVEVFFLYFKNVVQETALRLMASKLSVAGIIEGNFTDEGLSAMSDCQDLTTLLAQELALGIRDEVDDIRESFKQMSFVRPKVVEKSAIEKHVEEYEQQKNSLVILDKSSAVATIKTGGLSQKIDSKTKEVAKFEAQISLFDFIKEAV